MRARFFAGQLLGEDDLQSISDYMLAKRRLTNRSVFGAGVVCGLEVGCNRCESGSVAVSPGYALDCCGNDIVVDCPEEVDVIALVRELRDRQGVDCGEPCEKHPRQEYVLNIVYAEQPTDPVAPYAADDCAAGDCEFSRVREGYRFEISCDAAEAQPTIVDVLRDCLDIDDDTSKEEARSMSRVIALAMTKAREEPKEAEEAEKAQPVEDIPLKREFDDLEGDGVELMPAFRLVARATAALAGDAAGRAGHGHALAINTERRRMLETRSRALAARMLASDELAALSPDERERVTRILNTAAGQHDLAAVPAADQAVLGQGFTAPEAEEAYVRDATMLRSRVLRGLVDSGRAGCREYRDVSGLKLDRLDERSPAEARVLGRVFLSLFARCPCSAANPPCPTCTDVLVPIARVRVEGCDVVSVCDLERHWVHSPRALAYWFPVVEVVREVLESRCCPEERYEKKVIREREIDVLRDRAMASAKLVRPPEESEELAAIMKALGDEFAVRGRTS
ncbi:hypothetical protein [Terrabacter sp. RAF57]|uniref:hypothetical protein n=1 Tax=Terrabacter sp. RAF57 TaxID=3233063 RepID=UPI003F9BF386